MDKYDVIYILIVFIVALIFGLLLVFPIMWLWNYLMPMIFGLPELTYWQTYGLYVLINLFVPSRSSSSSSSRH